MSPVHFDAAGRVHSSFHFPYKLGRVSCDDSEVRHGLCDYATSSNDGTSANIDAWQYHDATSYPAIFADMNLLARLRAFGALSNYRVEWMFRCIEMHIRPNNGPVPDCYKTGIEKNSVEIDKDVLPELYVKAIIHLRERAMLESVLRHIGTYIVTDIDWGLYPRILVKEAIIVFRRCCFWGKWSLIAQDSMFAVRTMLPNVV